MLSFPCCEEAQASHIQRPLEGELKNLSNSWNQDSKHMAPVQPFLII